MRRFNGSGDGVTTLVLVRHAHATEPGDLALPGPDRSLTAAGRNAAAALARHLGAYPPATVYTSDARRAVETARAVCAVSAAPLIERRDLREIDLGAWGGRTYAEVVRDDPAASAYFADPSSSVPPGGERLEEVVRRVVEAMAEIAGRHVGERVVVVGHAGALRLGLAAMLGMPIVSYWRLRLDPASVSTLTWTTSGVVLEVLNDTHHLRSDGQVARTWPPRRW